MCFIGYIVVRQVYLLNEELTCLSSMGLVIKEMANMVRQDTAKSMMAK